MHQSYMGTSELQLRKQEARIGDKTDRTVEEQEALINQQVHVEEELTKQDVKKQEEAIARLRKDVVDETKLIGVTILK